MQVGHGDACSQDCVVGVFGGEGRGNLSPESVQLHGGHTAVETLNHLHGDMGLPGRESSRQHTREKNTTLVQLSVGVGQLTGSTKSALSP